MAYRIDEHGDAEDVGEEDELLAPGVADLAGAGQEVDAQAPLLLRQPHLADESVQVMDEAAHHLAQPVARRVAHPAPPPDPSGRGRPVNPRGRPRPGPALLNSPLQTDGGPGRRRRAAVSRRLDPRSWGSSRERRPRGPPLGPAKRPPGRSPGAMLGRPASRQGRTGPQPHPAPTGRARPGAGRSARPRRLKAATWGRDDGVGLSVGRAEAAAQHVAEFVMQRHADRAETGPASPGTIKRFAPRFHVSRIGDDSRQRSREAAYGVLSLHGGDRVRVPRVQGFHCVGDGVQPPRWPTAWRAG